MLTHKFGDFVFVHVTDQEEPTISIRGFEFKDPGAVIDLLNQINKAYLFTKDPHSSKGFEFIVVGS